VFDKHIATLYRELRENNPMESHQKDYAKFFFVKTTPKRGINVAPNKHAIREAKRYMGYFALITNETMDAPTALHIYRQKDVVEKAFGNIKERFNMRRLLVSSERSLDGKLFVLFIAFILISNLYKRMKDSELINKNSLHQLIDKLDVIKCFENSGKALCIG
jgi:transposase